MLTDFAKIWICHSSRSASDREQSICFVALEIHTGHIFKQGPNELGDPMITFDDCSLFVAWDAHAEIGLFLSRGWAPPVRIINLSAEFRLATNGFPPFAGNTLFGALTQLGLNSSGAIEKVPNSESYSACELDSMMVSCGLVVEATARLFKKMAASIDLPRALLRGRFAAASAAIERTGIPIDAHTLEAIQSKWHSLYPKPTSHRLPDISVGADGRHRFIFQTFATVTGRCQTEGCILDWPSWLRGLITPDNGNALAFLDWSAEELGIAAAMSGDANLRTAYASGDPYIRFAIDAGAAPPDATRFTHPSVRAAFKDAMLSIQFGIGEEALAAKLNSAPIYARDILERHHQLYSDYWSWSDATVITALRERSLSTVFGWKLHIDGPTNERALRNFPVQAAGAEILRLAACLITEAGIRICATLHDAVLIESTAQKLQDDVELAQRLMAEASRIVLFDFELRTDVSVARFPDRLYGSGGPDVWTKMTALLRRAEN